MVEIKRGTVEAGLHCCFERLGGSGSSNCESHVLNTFLKLQSYSTRSSLAFLLGTRMIQQQTPDLSVKQL